ncbi:MAG: PDZ domain-containing protein [Sphingopyxis sp.]|nr:PDZ domain-containing protein [Sphingopyxis sp.]
MKTLVLVEHDNTKVHDATLAVVTAASKLGEVHLLVAGHNCGSVAEAAAKIAHFMALVARSVAVRSEVPDYVAQAAPAQGQIRAAMRAYLGTIPDYTREDLKGVLLAGVRPDSAAEKAGFHQGDLLIELDGHKIGSIHDFVYVLRQAKPGDRNHRTGQIAHGNPQQRPNHHQGKGAILTAQQHQESQFCGNAHHHHRPEHRRQAPAPPAPTKQRQRHIQHRRDANPAEIQAESDGGISSSATARGTSGGRGWLQLRALIRKYKASSSSKISTMAMRARTNC